MLEHRPANEDEVVLAFLRTELESARFGPAIGAALERVGGARLVLDADLGSEAENAARRGALGEARGWGRNERLFHGFPHDVTWQHVVLDPSEVDRIRFIDYSYWNELTGGSRRPRDVGSVLAQPDRLPEWLVALGDLNAYFDLAQLISAQGIMGDLIVIGTPDLTALVLLEGHARLTAFHLAGLHDATPLPCYLGTSPDVRSWHHF